MPFTPDSAEKLILLQFVSPLPPVGTKEEQKKPKKTAKKQPISGEKVENQLRYRKELEKMMMPTLKNKCRNHKVPKLQIPERTLWQPLFWMETR